MDKTPRITLEIPGPEGCDDEDSYALPVSTEVVDYSIDLLQCFRIMRLLGEPLHDQ